MAKKIDFTKLKIAFFDFISEVLQNKKTILVTVLSTFILMIVTCCTVFFATVKGAEKVMVPNVVGKTLTDALLELQSKELYGKIQLKYSDEGDDNGKILDQSPDGGAIVKAYRRVVLTVSRGSVLTEVSDYVGSNFEKVRAEIQTLFSGQKQLVTILDPVYKPSNGEAGIILSQDIEPGTKLTEPVAIQFVVSSGMNFEKTRIEDLVGKDVTQIVKLLPSSKVIFDFNGTLAQSGQKEGAVSVQQSFDEEYVENYTHVSCTIALPDGVKDGLSYGIFVHNYDLLPYAVSVKINVIDPDGKEKEYTSFRHNGGRITVPYAVTSGSELRMIISDKVVAKHTVD